MRKLLPALCACVFLLGSACGGGGAQPTATQPAAQAAPTIAATATTATEPQVQPTAIGTAAMPQPVETVVPAETAPAVETPQAVATVPADLTAGPAGTAGPQAAAGDRDAPLAIPANMLERLELQFISGEQPTGDDRRALTQNNGRQLFSNLWVASQPQTVFLVVDERFQFESEEGAQAFLEQSAEDVESAESQEERLRPLGGNVDLGDVTRAYQGTLQEQGQELPAYAFIFRSGDVVGRIAVIGDETLTRQRAIELARAGVERAE